MSSSASIGRTPHANRDHRSRPHWRHGGYALCEGGTRSRGGDAQGPVGEGLQHDGLEDPRDGGPTRGRRPACHLSCRRRSAGEIGRCETHRGNRVRADRHRLSARRRATATARLANLRATSHGPPGTGPPSMSLAPPRSVFTSRERRIIEAATTPERVQRWLESLPYNHEERGETLRTFRGVVRTNEAHCLEP